MKTTTQFNRSRAPSTGARGAATLLALALTGAALTGCADSSPGEADLGEGGGLQPGVGQGGAQDFGQFRQILEDGGIPGPETIDDVGFFNEHLLELPAADCGEDVCLHAQLGVMGNMFNGANCTLVWVGMNSPIDPDELERPPLNLAIAVDASGSMQGDSIAYVRSGLEAMLASLEPEDRVSLVSFSNHGTVLVEAATGDSEELADAIDGLWADGGTNLYDGLRLAYEQVDTHAEPGRQNRVILLSDGQATAGIETTDKILNMSAAYNELGYGLATIGMGENFDVEVMRGLAEAGSGAFYFLEDPAAVQEVFVEEVEAFLVPIAEEVEIVADIEQGYDLRATHGTKLAEVSGNQAAIQIPSLQIAHRASETVDEGGRRGGGGAILFEMMPTGLDPSDVGQVSFSYRNPGSDDWIAQEIEITSPLGPWETPLQGHFESDDAEKAFVMLNLYVGFAMAAERASIGDDGQALATLTALGRGVETWLQTRPDDDIEDDLHYIELFIANLEARGGSIHSPEPQDPWPAD